MNYYFLLEDEQSFFKVLPEWLKHMNFKCERVVDILAVKQNNYVLQSGQGVTQLITQVLYQTIDTLLDNPGKIDKLVVVVDAEAKTIAERKQEVFDKIQEKCIKENLELQDLGFEIVVLVTNRCFETWLLGCENIYPKEEVNKESFFYEYYKHYNIEENDPENMLSPIEFEKSIAKYHFYYLHELFRYKKIRYNKSKPKHVQSQEYFNGICNRADKTEHIRTFKTFMDFILSENTLADVTNTN